VVMTVAAGLGAGASRDRLLSLKTNRPTIERNRSKGRWFDGFLLALYP
jgi:hypothetical protein